MSLWSIVLDFKSAPLELRAKAVQKDAKFVEKISAGSTECIFISTCNRLELYVVGENRPDQSLKVWKNLCQLDESDLKLFQTFEGEEALRHLFRVASSMESMVVGETQIGGQVKRAYEEAIQAERVGPILHRCFQRAFKTAKKVRSQTEVGRLAVSVPSIAVKLAEKVFGDLTRKTVGIVGLGEMGRLSAEHFGSVQPQKLFLYNRTKETADRLANDLLIEKINAEVVRDPNTLLEQSDVIVSAVDGLIFKKEDCEKLDSRETPIFLLDLSVPPSIEKFEFKNVFFYSIDDLRGIAKENASLRDQEVRKAEKIIDGDAKLCFESLRKASASQALEHLSQKAESLTAAELAQLKSKLKHLSSDDWAEIEKMAHRLSHKVLQDPMVELRSLSDSSDEAENVISFFRNLFRI